MPRTESTIDIRKKQWFSQNVAPPPSYTRRQRASTTDKSKSVSSNSKSKSCIKSKPEPQENTKKTKTVPANVGFTIQFSLAKAMKSVKQQEKEFFRPTIPPQKMEMATPETKVRKKRVQVPKKRKPVLKRMIFDHETKQWKQEVIFENQGGISMRVVPIADMGFVLDQTRSTTSTTFRSDPCSTGTKSENKQTGSDASGLSLPTLSRTSSFAETIQSSATEDQISSLNESSDIEDFLHGRKGSVVSYSDLSATGDLSESETSGLGRFVSKTCTKDYTDLDSDNKKTTIEPGTAPGTMDDKPADSFIPSVSLSRESTSILAHMGSLEENLSKIVSRLGLADAATSDKDPSIDSTIDQRTKSDLEPQLGDQANTSTKSVQLSEPISRQTSLKLRNRKKREEEEDIDDEDDVVETEMRYLSSKGSKILVKRRSLKPPKKESESEDTEAENKEEYPGCKYLYKISNCRAVTNPRIIQNRTDNLQAVGVIEIYNGHKETGMMFDDHTCPYCVVEPQTRIGRWLSYKGDSQVAVKLYSKKDSMYYCKREKKTMKTSKTRNNRKTAQANPALLTIPEV